MVVCKYGSTLAIALLVLVACGAPQIEQTDASPVPPARVEARPVAAGAEFWQAVEKGDLASLRSIVESNPALVHSHDDEGQTPLQIAASDGRLEMIRLLLDRGAEIDAPARLQTTPLLTALAHRQPEAGRLLLERGADPAKANAYGKTPIHAAATHGYAELIEMLLDEGAEIEARDIGGETALHKAARDNRVDAANNSGETPLDLAVKRGHGESVDLLQDLGAAG